MAQPRDCFAESQPRLARQLAQPVQPKLQRSAKARTKRTLTLTHFVKSTLTTGTSQCASSISNRRCSSRL